MLIFKLIMEGDYDIWMKMMHGPLAFAQLAIGYDVLTESGNRLPQEADQLTKPA